MSSSSSSSSTDQQQPFQQQQQQQQQQPSTPDMAASAATAALNSTPKRSYSVTSIFSSLTSWYSSPKVQYSTIAERKLLQRIHHSSHHFLHTDSEADISNPTSVPFLARVGLVDIGDGKLINTIVIDHGNDDGNSSNNDPKELLQTSSTKKLFDHEIHATVHAADTRKQEVQDFPPQTPQEHDKELADSQAVEALFRQDAQQPDRKPTVVFTHGYAAGSMFYFRNLGAFARELKDWRIVAIDWLGMGNSSRVPFPNGKTEEEKVTLAEDFFVESLEAWRSKLDIQKFTLVGHSLGGYLSAVYAMKYPERVEKLILVSPAGIPREPEEVKTPAQSAPTSSSPSPTASASTIPTPDNTQPQPPQLPTRRRIPGWVTTLWNWNFTPQTFIRATGPWGPGLVEKYVTRRFQYLDADVSQELKDYIYHISILRGSGEYALASLLKVGAWARRPLCDRLPGKLSCRVSFLYGDIDWMNYKHAIPVCEAVCQESRVEARVAVVQDAGHHLYLDNPAAFNAAIIEELKSVRKGGVREGEVLYGGMVRYAAVKKPMSI